MLFFPAQAEYSYFLPILGSKYACGYAHDISVSECIWCLDGGKVIMIGASLQT